MNKSACILFLILFAHLAHSKDFGTYGTIFSITEEDLIANLQEKYQKLKESGELDNELKKYSSEIKNQIKRPKAIPGVVKVTKESYREFDPTIELAEDIFVPTDRNNIRPKLLYAKGAKINPLDYMEFDEPLVFIDGDDKSQEEFAIGYLKANNKSKILLINGLPGLKHTESGDYYYYFDQGGIYCKKFGISKVPSIVSQKDGQKTLTIHEVCLGKQHE